MSKKRCRECPVCGAKMKKGKYEPFWVDEAEGLSALLDDDGKGVTEYNETNPLSCSAALHNDYAFRNSIC